MHTHKKAVVAFGAGYVIDHFARKPREYDVHAVRREWNAQPEYPANVATHNVDATNYEAVLELVQKIPGSKVVIDSIPPANGTDISANRNVCNAAKASGVDFAIYLSSTSVYGGMNGEWVSEESETRPVNPKGEVRLAAEQVYRESGLSGCILRLAGIYGPGREISARVRSASRLNPDGYTNLIHVEDIGRVIEKFIEQGTTDSGFEVFNVVDDEPVTRRELYESYAKAAGIELNWEYAKDAGSDPQNQRVTNRRLKERLKPFSLLYPSYETGLAKL